MVLEKLKRSTEVKINEYKPNKREVRCLVDGKVTFVGDPVNEEQERADSAAPPYAIREPD